MTTVYVDDVSGNDTALGTSDTAAWQSLAPVNAAFGNGNLGPSDTVLLKSGGNFVGRPAIPAGLTDWLTVSSYGTGAKPRINAYKILNTSAGWTQHVPGVWKIDLTNTSTHSGYTAGSPDIGFLRVDGSFKGKRVWSTNDLASPWDFYCDGTFLYVKATGNPTGLASDIRAAPEGTVFRGQDYIRCLGLELVGGGSHGFQIGLGNSHVRVIGCEIHEMGGSLLESSGPTVRYGNGIEFYIGCSDALAMGNEIYDVFDVGLTMQGLESGANTSWTDCRMINNVIYHCSQDIELWSDGVSGAGKGFIRCAVEDNVGLFAGRGWSSAVRSNPEAECHLLSYKWELPADISVKRNVAYDPKQYRYASTSTPGGTNTVGLKAAENVVVLRKGSVIQYGHTETVDNPSAWSSPQAEASTSFIPLPVGAPTKANDAIAYLSGLGVVSSSRVESLQRALARVSKELERVHQLASSTAKPRVLSSSAGTRDFVSMDSGNIIESDNAGRTVRRLPKIASSWGHSKLPPITVENGNTGLCVIRPEMMNLARNPCAANATPGLDMLVRGTGATGPTYPAAEVLPDGSTRKFWRATAAAGTVGGAFGHFYGPFVLSDYALLGVELIPGNTISVKARVRTNLASGLQLSVRFRDISGTVIGSEIGGSFNNAFGFAIVNGAVIPAKCYDIQVLTFATALAAGDTADVTEFHIEEATTVSANYEDGASTGCAWSGTANGSYSTGPAMFPASVNVRPGQRRRLRQRASGVWVAG